jgi:arginyl-tRNA synthetase
MTASIDVLELSLAVMLADIREDLAAFGVEFDRWYSERELARSGAVEHALAELEARGALYPQGRRAVVSRQPVWR